MNYQLPSLLSRSARKVSTLIAGVVVAGVASTSSHALTIGFEVEDLTDVIVGEDLRLYRFHLSGHNFAPNQGFSIYFDDDLFGNLGGTAPNGDWLISIAQPDPGLAPFGDGLYDAFNETASPFASLADPFEVTFNWLGGSALAPSALFFELYTTDGGFEVIDSGTTTVQGPTDPGTGVPDAGGSLLLSLMGMGAVAGARKYFR